MFGKKKIKSSTSSGKSVRHKKDAPKPSERSTRKKSASIPYAKDTTKLPGDSRHPDDSAAKLDNNVLMPALPEAPMPERALATGSRELAIPPSWRPIEGLFGDPYSAVRCEEVSDTGEDNDINDTRRCYDISDREEDGDSDSTVRGNDVSDIKNDAGRRQSGERDSVMTGKQKKSGTSGQPFRIIDQNDYNKSVEQLRGKKHFLRVDDVIFRIRWNGRGRQYAEVADVQDIPGLEGLRPVGDRGDTEQYVLVDRNIHLDIPGVIYYIVRDDRDNVLKFKEINDKAHKANLFSEAQQALDRREAATIKGGKSKADAQD